MLLRSAAADEGDCYATLDMCAENSFSLAKELLTISGSSRTLDGLYLEWEPEMTASQAQTIRQLGTEVCPVGVWFRTEDNQDCYATAKALRGLGVRFINTDLPTKWLEEMPRGASEAELVELSGSGGREGDAS